MIFIPGGARFKIGLIIGLWTLLMSAVIIWLQVNNVRRNVHEEVRATNAVSGQLIERIVWISVTYGRAGLKEFLDHLGQVRAGEIRLIASDGKLLYESPSSAIKIDQSVPQWFIKWTAPPPTRVILPRIDFPEETVSATLEVRGEYSRAVLAGWQNTAHVVGGLFLLQMFVLVAVWVLIHRTLRHIPLLVNACEQVEMGNYAVRLPVTPPRESLILGTAFNRMAQSVEENSELKRQAQQALTRLEESQRFGHLLQTHIEEERRAIARELHDEMGQSVTAIHSLSHVLSVQGSEEARAHAALIKQEARHLHDAMQNIIPRLRPMGLELGLGASVAEMIRKWQANCKIAVNLHLDDTDGIANQTALTLFRIIQEALNNIAKHAQAKQVDIRLVKESAYCLTIRDDGVGLSNAAPNFGLIGMRERVDALKGSMTVSQGNDDGNGVLLTITLPLEGGQ